MSDSTNKNLVCGIYAHVDAGKTTLSEQLLFSCGTIRRVGRVDHKDTFLDNNEIERNRGITVFSKQAILTIGDISLTLLDTPGHVDFSAEAERTLSVLDFAILVISAPEGIQPHTETLWKLLKEAGIPVFVFINKVDCLHPAGDASGDSLRETFGSIISSLNNKLGEGFSDLTDVSALSYEEIASLDEDLIEKYLEGETPDDNDIRSLILSRRLFPCVFGSALNGDGVNRLIEIISAYAPDKAYADEFGARVIKITRDADGTRLTHIKITGGCLSVRDTLNYSVPEEDEDREYNEKITQIRIYNGEKFESVTTALPGTVAAVCGLTATYAGQGLGTETVPAEYLLKPVLSYEVIAPKDKKITEVLTDLRILAEEIPELNVTWDENHKKINILLMGDIQTQILKFTVNKRFGYDIDLGEGAVLYKETIADAVEGVGHFEPLRHYAEVHLLMEPLPRGSGLEFAADCSTDLLALNWQRLVLTHLKEKMHRGVLTRSPITDMRITLKSGKAHIKHTEGGDFRQASYRAVRQGLMQAGSILLEPYYEFTVTLPTGRIGRFMTDIEKMCGTCNPPEAVGDVSVITGRAPVICIRNYASELVSYTGGTGKIMLKLSGYDPCHNSEEVIESFGYDPTGDIRNSPDSVFCGHGSSFIVPWNEVAEHMHLPSCLEERADAGDENYVIRTSSEKNYGEDELKEVFEKTFGSGSWRTFKDKTDTADDDIYTPARPVVHEDDRNAGPKVKVKAGGGETKCLLIDGYNVIFAWDELKALAADNIDSARDALILRLSNYAGFKGLHTILVFDAYKVHNFSGEKLKYDNVEVIFTKQAETADEFISKSIRSFPKEYVVTVASSDGIIQLSAMGAGSRILSSSDLIRDILLTEEQIREHL
ncbi:MAG: TetM/TetW/TetO/TetS family tetracycline resistance ribosomal protection protein [Lachnospiraceae bacterium]|nr:TetM/TetW/TetO/TetS family tetracycline resistance ribosomal protection protein [Lachnospiraceae bacterium]